MAMVVTLSQDWYCGNTIVGPPPPHLWGAFGGTFVQYLYEYFVQ
eukprot:SAG31_NODE_1485_length_8151_cov_6.486215_1_plen_43_part_10